MAPRPTRVETDAEEIQVTTETSKPEISASVGDQVAVTTQAGDQTVIRTEVVEVV